MKRLGLMVAMQRQVESQAQRIGGLIRAVASAVESYGRDSREPIAYVHTLAILEMVSGWKRDMEERGPMAADAHAAKLAAMYRAMHGLGTGPTVKAAHLARVLDCCARLSDGQEPECAWDPVEKEGVRVAVRTNGVHRTALTWFAIAYPEDAGRLDVNALGRLATAFTAGVSGGRWPAMARWWKDEMHKNLAAASIEREFARVGQ